MAVIEGNGENAQADNIRVDGTVLTADELTPQEGAGASFCLRDVAGEGSRSMGNTGDGAVRGLSWERISTEQLVDDGWMNFRRLSYRFPDGNVFEPFYTYSTRDYVVVAATDEEGRYICVHQYRQGIEGITTEFPAGGIEKKGGRGHLPGEAPVKTDEDAFSAARRELLEETGYESDEWTFLLKTPSHATLSDNYAYIFKAENCRRTSSQKLDSTEFINVETFSEKEIEELLYQGSFQQSVHSLAWFLSRAGRGKRIEYRPLDTGWLSKCLDTVRTHYLAVPLNTLYEFYCRGDDRSADSDGFRNELSRILMQHRGDVEGMDSETADFAASGAAVDSFSCFAIESLNDEEWIVADPMMMAELSLTPAVLCDGTKSYLLEEALGILPSIRNYARQMGRLPSAEELLSLLTSGRERKDWYIPSREEIESAAKYGYIRTEEIERLSEYLMARQELLGLNEERVLEIERRVADGAVASEDVNDTVYGVVTKTETWGAGLPGRLSGGEIKEFIKRIMKAFNSVGQPELNGYSAFIRSLKQQLKPASSISPANSGEDILGGMSLSDIIKLSSEGKNGSTAADGDAAQGAGGRRLNKRLNNGKTVTHQERKIYPNDPCPCGSGKKYKKCCGRK